MLRLPMHVFIRLRVALWALLCLVAAHAARAQMIFDFETTDQLATSPLVSGDASLFVQTDEPPGDNGQFALKFDASAPRGFQSFVIDDPTAMDAGTISIWFYDTVGAGTGSTFEWRMSIILEDRDNPADFGAVEIADLPYGGRAYYASEGVGDRGAANDRFESSMPPRGVGWHRVDFEVGTTASLIRVDGHTTSPLALATEVAAPGSEKRLRLRIMADSPTLGGFNNWVTDAGDSYPAQPGLVFIDDVTFAATAPAAATRVITFEAPGDVPDYDTVGEFMGPVATDIPEMRGFVNAFNVTTSQSLSGAHAAYFANGTPTLRSFAIDLANLPADTTSTVRLRFHDALGANADFDKVGGAIMLESAADPAKFIAAEIWNASYPFGGPVPNYYFVARPIPSGSGFYSNYFGDRAIGWHTVEIQVGPAGSRMSIDGIFNANGAGVIFGPGLGDQPRLRIMADSPTLGGFGNYADPTGWTDPETPELDALYLVKVAPYFYVDNIEIPLPVNASHGWDLYE